MDFLGLGLFYFCTGMDSAAGWRIQVGTGMDLPTGTACWPTAIVNASVHGRDIRTDNGRDKVKT